MLDAIGIIGYDLSRKSAASCGDGIEVRNKWHTVGNLHLQALAGCILTSSKMRWKLLGALPRSTPPVRSFLLVAPPPCFFFFRFPDISTSAPGMEQQNLVQFGISQSDLKAHSETHLLNISAHVKFLSTALLGTMFNILQHLTDAHHSKPAKVCALGRAAE